MTAHRILIVDNDVPALKDLAACMRRMFTECQVVVASNGAVALGRLRDRPFDLVLASQDMPGMSGLELAEMVHRCSPATRIVLMVDDSSRLDLRGEPANRYLRGRVRKPLGLEQIWCIVHASLPSHLG